MRFCFLILIPFSLIDFTKAQGQIIAPSDTLITRSFIFDTLKVNADTAFTKLHQVVDRKDSLAHKIEQPLDSITQQLEQKKDSLTSKINTKIENSYQYSNLIPDSIKAIEQKIQSKVKPLDNISPPSILLENLNNQLEGIPSLQIISEKTGKIKASAKKWVGLEKIKSLNPTNVDLKQFDQIQNSIANIQNKVKTLPKDKVSQISQFTSSLEQKAIEKTGLKELQQLSGQVDQWKQQSVKHHEQLKQYQDQNFLREQAQAKLLEKAKNHFATHGDKLKEAQEKLAKFKRKYTGELTEEGKPIKQSSLQGKPLSERIVYGGQLQVVPGPPVSVDLSPMLGYQISKHWMVGVGGTYRANFQPEKKYIVRSGEIYGVRAFTEHQIIKGFFMHGAYEMMNTEVNDKLQDSYTREWVEGVLVGVGKNYHISRKIEGRVMILYNLMHQEKTPYPRPWMIRFGFNVTKN